MRNKWFKRIFPLISLVLLAPWPVAYAYDVSGSSIGYETVQITAAEAAAQPTWTAFGKAIGSVKPGDLFYIDAPDHPADIAVTLYITNTDELVHSYRYLILKVKIYAEIDKGTWEEVSGDDGEVIPETFITLQNAQVSFTLPGLARYKVAIEGGSINCVNANPSNDSASPRFYLVAS